MAREKIIELTLQKAQLDIPGEKAGSITKRMVIVTLVWPRPRVDHDTSAKTVEFQDGMLDLGKALWSERIMAKELVSGPFGMRVAVTGRVAEPLNSDFLRFLASGVMKAAATAAHNAVGTPAIADMAKLPVSFLADVTKDGKVKPPKVIASGLIDLQTDRLVKAKKVAIIKIDLEAEQDMYVLPKGKGAARPAKRRRVLKKGDPCGSVTFKAKVYN